MNSHCLSFPLSYVIVWTLLGYRRKCIAGGWTKTLLFLIVGALGTFSGGPQIVGAYIGGVLFAAMAKAVAAILGKNSEQKVVPYSFTFEGI